MKKIINVLFAAAVSAFAMTSCAEKEIVTYNPDVTVVPALEAIAESYVLTDGGEFATLNFSAAEFGIPTAARYTAYADINEDFSTKQSLGNVATDTAGITVSANTLNNALMSLNCEHSVPVTVYFRIEAQMMGESSPVQTVAALVSNTISSSITPFDAEKVYPMVYVTGAPWGWPDAPWAPNAVAHLYSYAEDEENYVGVVDFGADCADYGFKITGDTNWDNGNWGTGDMTSTEPEAPSIILWNDGGSGNISNYTSFRYYNFPFVQSSLTLNMIHGFNVVTVAGDFNGWATDATPMQQIRTNGKFYVDIDVTAAGGFKFVLDNGTWIGTGEGEDGVGIGTGDNIPVEPGQYRFYLDLNDWQSPTYKLSSSDYGKPVDDGGDGDTDDPEDPEDPDQPTGAVWGIKGDFDGDTGWSVDYPMTEFPAGSGIWVSGLINFAEGNQFKLQYNSWEKEIGAAAEGDTLRTGIAYQGLTSGGKNFGVSASQAGMRKVVLNTNDNTVYILGWSLIGELSGDSWGNDFPMLYNQETGEWSIAAVSAEGGFKLRWCGQWSTSDVTVPDRGLPEGTSFSVGTPFALVQGGGNIVPDPAGVYDMVYSPEDETLTVTVAE